jgi:hypothetical protein
MTSEEREQTTGAMTRKLKKLKIWIDSYSVVLAKGMDPLRLVL